MKFMTAVRPALFLSIEVSLKAPAFNPQRETGGGVTLAIEGFDGEHKPDHVWIARTVPCAKPLDDSAAEPEWQVSQGLLRLKCDARSFGYVVNFR